MDIVVLMSKKNKVDYTCIKCNARILLAEKILHNGLCVDCYLKERGEID